MVTDDAMRNDGEQDVSKVTDMPRVFDGAAGVWPLQSRCAPTHPPSFRMTSSVSKPFAKAWVFIHGKTHLGSETMCNRKGAH